MGAVSQGLKLQVGLLCKWLHAVLLSHGVVTAFSIIEPLPLAGTCEVPAQRDAKDSPCMTDEAAHENAQRHRQLRHGVGDALLHHSN
jgi:hypothetical protein